MERAATLCRTEYEETVGYMECTKLGRAGPVLAREVCGACNASATSPLPSRFRSHYNQPMPSAIDDRPASLSLPSAAPSSVQTDASGVLRNFVAMAAGQIALRVGWIFKTESVIIPAVFDSLGGSPFLRGMLPLVNRLGHSVPPLLAARRVKLIRHKKGMMLVCMSAMAVVKFSMAALLWAAGGGEKKPWMVPMFLLLYTLFFVVVGLNNLAAGLLQGKLIPAAVRGRLMLAATTLGAAGGIVAVFLLMFRWLENESQLYLLFLFAGICFAVAALTTLGLREPADNHEEPRRSLRHVFTGAADVLRGDPAFSRLVIVAMLFSSSLCLFPHYQALAFQGSNLTMKSLALWVIVQNIGSALFSVLAGPLADARGNRIVLRFLLLGLCLVPLLSLALSHAGGLGSHWFWIVFVLIGLTPITFKVIMNYTLELCEPSEQSLYLSTLSLCMAAPVMFSPLAGWLIGETNFTTVFLIFDGFLLLGWLLTWRLSEPRHHAPPIVVTEAAEDL